MTRPQTTHEPEEVTSPWVQTRAPVSIDDEAVWIGPTRVKFSASTPAGILAAYIDLINEVRAEPLNDVLLTRESDLRVLGEALDLPQDELLTRLRHLLRQPPESRAWA